MLKKSLSILMLMVFIFNMTGIYIAFKTEQSVLRAAMKHRIKSGVPEQYLKIFRMPRDGYQRLNWKRQGKEFRTFSGMYDIVRAENHGDSLVLFCIHDTQETELFAKLDELIKQHSGRDLPSGRNAVRLFKWLSSLDVVNVVASLCNSVSQTELFNWFLLKIPVTHPEVLLPPPWIFSS